jgi:hypothetical protein
MPVIGGFRRLFLAVDFFLAELFFLAGLFFALFLAATMPSSCPARGID